MSVFNKPKYKEHKKKLLATGLSKVGAPEWVYPINIVDNEDLCRSIIESAFTTFNSCEGTTSEQNTLISNIQVFFKEKKDTSGQLFFNDGIPVKKKN